MQGTDFHCSDIEVHGLQMTINFIENSRPKLLILDGHASHVFVEITELVKVNGVHILCVPAHTMHILMLEYSSQKLLQQCTK